MAKDPLKPPVPDMLFHTIPGKPVNPAYFEVAGQLSDAIFGSRPEVSEPKLSLKTHRKAIEAWKDAAQTWKDRCLRAEENNKKWQKAYNVTLDEKGAWREVAADLAFGGRPYPAQDDPDREALAAKFRAIRERKTVARDDGHPEDDMLI